MNSHRMEFTIDLFILNTTSRGIWDYRTPMFTGIYRNPIIKLLKSNYIIKFTKVCVNLDIYTII